MRPNLLSIQEAVIGGQYPPAKASHLPQVCLSLSSHVSASHGTPTQSSIQTAVYGTL